MSAAHWWAFAIATFFICGTPGPNMLHVMHSSIRHGLKGALPTMLGCLLAVLLMTASSAAGLGVLLQHSPLLFTGLRYAGAAYLVWLGIKSWRAPVADAVAHAEAEAEITPHASRFWHAFMVGMSNPKLILFATAFFPQFIDAGAPQAPQLLVLFATFLTLEIGWYFTYALGGRRIAHFLRRGAVRRGFNRVTGGVFMGFGLMLLRHSA